MKRPSKIKPTNPEGKIEIKGRKYNSNRYFTLFSSDPVEEFDKAGELVQRKKLKWVHYKDGTHYYLILK